jgi:hypothetical protein
VSGVSYAGARLGIVLAAPVLVIVMMIALVMGAGAVAFEEGGGSQPEGEAPTASVSAFARADIPANYLRLYIAAGAKYGIDWAILAGIGKVECDHGRDPSPSCTKEGAENSAGAGGPMQFLASTWATYGVDGDGDGRIDRWDPADAIFSAANYLSASGAPQDYRKAIYAYNHAWWYVEEVEGWAARYRGSSAAGDTAGLGSAGEGATSEGRRAISQRQTDTPVLYVPGEEAKLLRGNGHVALIPEDVPAVVQAMIVAGNELQELPYGPTGHPNPLGASSEDCSSTVNYVLYRSGVRPLKEIVKDNPLAQDYVNWGEPGPGRWVTIYAADTPTPHVFMVIAGLRLDTSHNGTDEGPNRFEDGPRWRLLPYIPTWAHWSVRHPPGL